MVAVVAKVFVVAFSLGYVSGGLLPYGNPHLRCSTGGCGVYLSIPNDNQCPKNAFLDLAHPSDPTRYCRCDHNSKSICEMTCAPGTYFDAEVRGCVHRPITGQAPCQSRPCGEHGVSCQAAAAGSPVPWTCSCGGGTYGWNCQFNAKLPCEAVTCDTGFDCRNEAASWWPVYVPYKCVPNVCFNNPCNQGGTCTRANNDRGYTCRCSNGYYGARCQCGPGGTNPCLNNPCQNGGTCETPTDVGCNSYRCTCPYNYIGTNCGRQDCPNSVCRGLVNHIVPHPNNCRKYCSCSAQIPHVFTCPAGRFFNVNNDQCSDRTCMQG